MSKPVIITADSVCDLPPELLSRFNVQILPLTVQLGEQSLKDGLDITPEDIYAAYQREQLLPKTSAISPQEFIDAFTPLLSKGYEVVHLDISAQLSACVQNAAIAAAELEGVYPVDSRHLSTGMGLVVLEACRLRDQGLSAAQIAQGVSDYTARVRTSFVLDTLEYMWKGGRCGGVTALGANLLHIKPCLEMQEGMLKVCKKYRGAMNKVYAQYVADRLNTPDIEQRYIFLTHSGHVDQAVLDQLRDMIAKACPAAEVFVTQAGCTVTSHCGPATLGVLFAVTAG